MRYVILPDGTFVTSHTGEYMRITRAAVKTGLALLASTVALVGMTTTANAATGADGFAILDASAGNQAHVCHILGTDDDYHEAIVCVDINTKVSGDQVLIQGQVEAYCQDDNGTVVQCANIMSGGEISSTGGVWYSYAGDCGHSLGACPTGREYSYSPWMGDGTSAGESGCASNPSEALWSIAVGVATTIELPGSDDSYTLSDTDPNDGSNESTGHYYICYN
jgi:hypothetical protein